MAISTLALSPDGRRALSGGQERTVFYWDVETGKRLAPPLQHASDIVHVTFDATGRLLATSSIADKKACVWDVRAVQSSVASAERAHTPPQLTAHTARQTRKRLTFVLSLALGADGELVVPQLIAPRLVSKAPVLPRVARDLGPRQARPPPLQDLAAAL